MHGKPLVSILTPVYNQALYIEETLNGVLGQTYQNWEWIILDDGSIDNTGDIIRRFKDSRIKYHVQEHAGREHLARTFNNALGFSTGDFIALLDGDDFWPEKTKLAIQLQSFSEPDTVLSYGESCVINQNGKMIGHMRIPADKRTAHNNPIGSALNILLLKRYCFLPNSTVMIKKEALQTIGGFVEAHGLNQDFPTWTRLALEGRFAPVPLCIGYWRRHISSSNLNTNPQSLFDAGIEFLRDFVIVHEAKLQSLGLSYNQEMLEKNWEECRREYFDYLPYNRAMLMLRLGLFEEAKAEFRKFLELAPSFKSKCIYSLINASGAVKTDLVNPAAAFKGKLKSIFQKPQSSDKMNCM